MNEPLRTETTMVSLDELQAMVSELPDAEIWAQTRGRFYRATVPERFVILTIEEWSENPPPRLIRVATFETVLALRGGRQFWVWTLADNTKIVLETTRRPTRS